MNLIIVGKGEKLAQEFANKLNRGVFYYSKSRGGSSCALVEPN